MKLNSINLTFYSLHNVSVYGHKATKLFIWKNNGVLKSRTVHLNLNNKNRLRPHI